ncbi:MAG: hypothetical protein FWD68_02240 [Alphaproteobacteria bacterium]|nr:hypothetical protein [Alphaproteobacteria bacterium]
MGDNVGTHLLGFEDEFWNLGQVIAWAQTRNPVPVDALSDSTWEMPRRPHSIISGMPHFAVKFARGSVDFAPREAFFRSEEEVREAVLNKLRDGTMTATGQPRSSLVREPIAAGLWADLTVDDNVETRMTIRQHDGQVPAWHDVRVPRNEVMAAFPPRIEAVPVAEEAPDSESGDEIPVGEVLEISAGRGSFDR